jgi:hypothetical protein
VGVGGNGGLGRVIISGMMYKTEGRHGNTSIRPHLFSPGLAR